VISILVIALFIDVVVSRGSEGVALTNGTQPDASVFVSTLILLYTVFVAAYGTLLPIVVTKERDAWEWLALGLMVFAIGLDLYRIANSLGDLYTTTMRHLTPGQIHDTSYEFIHYYFSINVVVIAIALFVVSRRNRTADGGQLDSDRPQMTDPQ
jgi:isoprenylcysteine carboxyl methyltransferase (ICMT) family protein YpbQ